MTEPIARDKRSSRVQVLEAIRALSNYEMPVTSETIARHTGLKMVIIADCIKELRERDEIWSPERGVYRLQQGETSIAVSITFLPGGGAKIEKGDVVMDLNHHELRTQLAPALAGSAMHTMVIEQTHQTMVLAERNRKLERRIAALEAKADPAQRDLLRESAQALAALMPTG